MRKIFVFVFSFIFVLPVAAQTATLGAPEAQPFGKIDKEDLEMKACDFEKDANAEVLFDKCSVYFNTQNERIIDRHIRIKIFNETGKNEANIKVSFIRGNRPEQIADLQAETFNLNNGAIAVTKVDSKQIFTQQVNKVISEMVFSFPDVQPGCVVEYKYTLISSSYLLPVWYFQSLIPTRYSEISTDIPGFLSYRYLPVVSQPYVKNTDEVKALANIPSLPEEPFMTSKKDNVERILFQLTGISRGSMSRSFPDTWDKVGKELKGYDNFGGQLKRSLNGEKDIAGKAGGMGSTVNKIAFIFNEVKDQMKWDGGYGCYTNEGTVEAWNKKSGNAAEINLILYHLLQRSGVKAFPMLVSTKNNGKVYPAYPNSNQFNKTVVYIPIDTANYYVLDATGKYNVYSEIPRNLLNSFGLCVNADSDKYDLVFLQKAAPVLQTVFVNAEIRPDGKISGTAKLNSSSYHRISAVERYKTEGEKNYINYLRDGDNNLKISSVSFENMDSDTLPLIQTINFTMAPVGTDENYIYFNPNLFTRLRNNPFLSEKRVTDIDFEYRNNYSINCIFKLPAGYKTDALPKSISMVMPDKSIIFKRIAAEQDGSIGIRYYIEYKKSLYFKQDYPEIFEFFKRMYELLNEQVVLKKI